MAIISAVDMAVPIQDTGNLSAYTSAAFTPVAGRLYLLCVTHSDAAPEATVPTVSTTTGLTFVQVGSSVVYDTIASNVHRLTVFRAMKASGLANGTYTVNLADAGTGCAAFLIEFAGVLTTGTDGADAVRQPTTNNADATANPSVSLAAFASTNNATFACVGHDAGTAAAATGALIPATPLTYSTPATRLAGLWSDGNIATPAFTLAACNWAAMAIEIVNSEGVFLARFNRPILQAAKRAAEW